MVVLGYACLAIAHNPTMFKDLFDHVGLMFFDKADKLHAAAAFRALERIDFPPSPQATAR